MEFKRDKSALTGVVKYLARTDEGGVMDFDITVDGSGSITLDGTLGLSGRTDLDRFAKALSQAWAEMEDNGKRARAMLEGREVEI